VGRVEQLSPTAGGTDALILMHSEYAPLHQDARAVILTKNLLGERYIELHRGQQGSIPAGGLIDQDHTLTPVEVAQVLDALSPDVRDRLAITINSLGEATAGQGPNLNDQAGSVKQLAGSLEVIAHTLAANQDHLDVVISSLRKVIETLAQWHSEFRALVTQWDQLMVTLASREQNLQNLFIEQDRVMQIFDQALSGNAATSLNAAIAEGPSALNSANHYISNGNIAFPRIEQNTSDISALFIELSSVMSGCADAQCGHHAWRVYNVANKSCPAPPPGLPSDINAKEITALAAAACTGVPPH
jgi:virulence factor Mce-like protein